MLFLCYPKCSTCAKAARWLDEKGISYSFRDIKLDNPTYDELKAWREKSGLPTRRLFNMSGMRYRELSPRDRLERMGEEERFRLLASDGMLVKRPVLVSDSFAPFGFDEKEWEKALLGK